MINHPSHFLYVDGQSLTHHAVHSTLLDPVLMTLDVQIGSWPGAADTGKPHQLTELHFQYDSWTPADFMVIEDSVMTHPDWLGAGPAKTSPKHRWNPGTQTWSAPPVVSMKDLSAVKWTEIKQQRVRLLANSDWVVIKATEAGWPVASEWVTYRQALRDIPLQVDPWSIVWPVAP